MEQFNNTFIIQTLKKYYKHLLVISILSGTLSILFSSSLFITPKYKSTAVLYPSNVSPYSNESQTEQMVQLLQSADIRDRIIDTLNLYKHYNIDINHPQKKSIINNEFAENFSVSKTEFESIEITILDEDPAMASKIVENLIDFADKKIQAIQKQKAFEVVKLNKQMFSAVKNQLDSVDTLIKNYSRKYGILDYGSQTSIAQKAYFKAVLKGNNKSISEAKNLLNNLTEHGFDFVYLGEQASTLRAIYNTQTVEYYKSIREYEKIFTYNNIVSKPVAADKKAYPVRWIIVAMSVLSSLFLALLVLLVFNKSNSEDAN
jgi:uncharacterized protein involved in exopolysaccharide biosynthesis